MPLQNTWNIYLNKTFNSLKISFSVKINAVCNYHFEWKNPRNINSTAAIKGHGKVIYRKVHLCLWFQNYR